MVAILDFWLTQKATLCKGPSNNYSSTVWVKLNCSFIEKLLFSFSLMVLCQNFSQWHQSWLLDQQKIIYTFRGSIKEHFFQGTIPSHVWFQRRYWSLSQSKSIIGSRSHVEFQNETKIMRNVKYYTRNISTMLGFNWAIGLWEIDWNVKSLHSSTISLHFF